MMIKSFLVLLFTLILSQLNAAEGAFNQIQKALSIQLDDGTSTTLDRDSFIRQINVRDNLGKWYAEVRLVDDENRVINDKVYKVSRKYLNMSVGVMFFDSLSLYDHYGNDEGSIPGGVNLVRLGEGDFPWPHYLLSVTDDDGHPIYPDGTPWDAKSGDPYPTFKVHKKTFEAKLLDNKVRELIFISEQEKGIVDGVDCNQETTLSDQEAMELGRVKPKPRPKDLKTNQQSPYEVVMDSRGALQGTNSCTSKRRAIEERLLSGSDWEGLSLHEKADKVYDLAKEVREEIVKVSDQSGKNQRGSSRFANSVNPHYFPDSGIKPELVACIVFQETEGHLNFTSHNVTYCHNTRTPSSTAHGLTQFTRTTFRMMKNHPDGDQAPYLTKFTEPLKGLSATKAHKEMSRYPGAQIELAYRLLNHEYKRAYVINPNKSRTELIRDAVEAYDKDNQSEYLRNVMDKCLPCMKKSGNDGSDCYSDVYE